MVTLKGSKQNGKALVIGASMAGLLTARVLANHYQEVVLLERDTFPEVGHNRKGVPQGKHIHVLLERGHQIMESYLPGLTHRLTELGAVIVDDVSTNVRWFHSGDYHQPSISGVSGLAVSRPTLEGAIRECVLESPNVHAIQGCSVMGLVTTKDHSHVIGVRYALSHNTAEPETMMADFVVDAGGRGSRSPAWLESLGYQRPEEEEVRIGMGYATCHYRRRPEHMPGINGIVLMATPPDKRLGVMLAQDGDRWVVTVGGYLGDHAPSDPIGFLKAVKALPTPDIYRVIKDAEPLHDPDAYTFPANLRRRYDKLCSFPQGYLVIGDALCSFNPIYGQGMTVAALEANALGEHLSENEVISAKTYFAKVSKIIDDSWSAAVGTDLSFPEVEGQRTPLIRFLNWYFSKLHIAAHSDADVSVAFLKVINMISPPPSILHPRIIWRVLKANLQSGQRSPSKEQSWDGQS